MRTLLCLVVLAAVSMAADLTGKWTGSFNISAPSGETHESGIVLNLKQNGPELTGTAGPEEGEQYAIVNGKVDGAKVTFDVKRSEEQILKFELAIEGDRIKGGATMSANGETRTAKVDAGRAK